ncbi:PAS domain-containing protein, partial [bacterium]|nr:PAS domain-containing protein [bacterium]
MKLFKYYTQLLLYLSFIGFLSVNSNARTQNSTSLDINKESRFVRISLEQGLSQVSVYCIMQDTRGFMWFGTEEGLNKYDGYDFTIYRHDPDDINSLTSNYLLSLFEDSEGYLWIGTRGGLNRFDSKAEKFTRFQYEAQNPNSLSNNFVRSINEDDGGNLWIGTYGGINKLDIQERNFIHFQHQANRPHSLSNNYVRAIYEDTGDIVWVGTFRGLNKYDRKKDTFTHYQHLADNSHSISDNTVRSLLVDSRDCLWIGTRNGLDKFDKNNNKFTHYYHQVDNPASLSNSDVRTIYEDSRGSLWIGTYRGLNKLDDKKETFTRYLYDKDDQCSISNDFVWAIHEDAEGSLWIGTSGGLNEFDREEERFTSYHHQVGNPRSLSNDFVRSIYDDARGNLWIGTRGGINKFDRKEKIFTVYREKDGLPNDVIYGILGDDQNNLWLSTNKGISKFNPQTKVFNNYDVKAGLQSNEFNAGAFHRGLSGRMYFGGIKGYNEFFPDSIKSNTTIPNVVITDFLLFNKSVSVSDTSVLKQNISYTKTIILNYTDFIFAFEFSSLSYSQSEKNQFAYKLEGFNENWIDTDYKHRRATYTDLSPGEYVFRVKASNNDAYWNEKETSIKVIILPPPWRTWWAYTLYAILIMSLIIWFIQFERNKARYKQIELKRLQAIFDNTTSVMVMKDMENRFIMVNRRFEELHNINRDEAIGKTLYDIFPSELAASFVANDKEVLKKNRAIEFEDQIMFEDGLHTYISVRFPLCDTDQKPYALCGIFTDITLRKQAEEMMIQS